VRLGKRNGPATANWAGPWIPAKRDWNFANFCHKITHTLQKTGLLLAANTGHDRDGGKPGSVTCVRLVDGTL